MAILTEEQLISNSKTRLNDKNMNPIVVAAGYELIRRMFQKGINIIFVQAFRSTEYQNELYAQGRTTPGDIVTNARGGSSAHNYGLALDYAIFMPDGKTISWDTVRDGNNDRIADWLEVAREAENLGFEWGGNWEFVDKPHIQMLFDLTISQLIAGKRPPTTVKSVTPAPPIIKALVPTPPVRIKPPTVNIILDGKEWESDGYIYNERTYVPIRAFVEALGSTKVIGWDTAKKVVTLDGTLVQSTIVDDFDVNGTTKGYALAVEICDIYKKTIVWDGTTRTVTIT
jgi:peptidoglycan L-alanyl-D-glutamate endopeptidase CwlK